VIAGKRAAGLVAFFPALFVLLWSTGFIAAKYGLPYAPPLTFLLYRFLLVAALMTLVARIAHVEWPKGMAIAHCAVAGLLVHGIYLGGVFVAIARGAPAGVSAMIVGLQPLLTVVVAWLWLDERVMPRQWIGLVIGVLGVALVVGHKLGAAGPASVVALLAALAAISFGTLYQKHYCRQIDLRAGSSIQFIACALAYLPLAAWLDAPAVQWTAPFIGALAWSVLVLSIISINLLYLLLRKGAAADVARLFFLVPAVTAVMAFVLFDEVLSWVALAGMAMIAVGVVLGRSGGGNGGNGGDSGSGSGRAGSNVQTASWSAGLACAAYFAANRRVPAMRSCRNSRSPSIRAHRKLNASATAATFPKPKGCSSA
jgi:drug/metabolite transporter (DMT)-like permease